MYCLEYPWLWKLGLIYVYTGTVNNEKHFIRWHVLQRSRDRLRESLQISSLCVRVCVCCRSSKAQWFPLTGCVIDHKKCWIAQSGQESGKQKCTRDIDRVNGGSCDGLCVAVLMFTLMNSFALRSEWIVIYIWQKVCQQLVDHCWNKNIRGQRQIPDFTLI